MTGFISLSRKIMDWEWWDDLPTRNVWLVLLMTANWKDKSWQGITVKRGQMLTSLPKLVEATGYSTQQVRTALSNLESTGEITQAANNKFRIITVVNYDKYQNPDNRLDTLENTEGEAKCNRQLTGKSTGRDPKNQQATNRLDTLENTEEQRECNRQLTGNQQAGQQANQQQLNNNITINNKEKKKVKKKRISIQDQIASLPAELHQPIYDFVEMRKKIKAPLTERGLELIISKAYRLARGDPHVMAEIFNQSVERSWRGVFPLKEEKKTQQEKLMDAYMELSQEGELGDG